MLTRICCESNMIWPSGTAAAVAAAAAAGAAGIKQCSAALHASTVLPGSLSAAWTRLQLVILEAQTLTTVCFCPVYVLCRCSCLLTAPSMAQCQQPGHDCLTCVPFPRACVLQVLMLSGHNFSSTMPAAWTRFKLVILEAQTLASELLPRVCVLQVLMLAGHKFNGTMPASWTLLSQLRAFALCGCTAGAHACWPHL
jgi:hypothetical protein